MFYIFVFFCLFRNLKNCIINNHGDGYILVLIGINSIHKILSVLKTESYINESISFHRVNQIFREFDPGSG